MADAVYQNFRFFAIFEQKKGDGVEVEHGDKVVDGAEAAGLAFDSAEDAPPEGIPPCISAYCFANRHTGAGVF
ncbi:MAG: hypothetical protein LBI02_06075 [Opitutaceae bacterium]|jgi:hypothetical protein|nr:hypothetical protein [Opitutaceae bacterium]